MFSETKDRHLADQRVVRLAPVSCLGDFLAGLVRCALTERSEQLVVKADGYGVALGYGLAGKYVTGGHFVGFEGVVD